MKFEICVFIFFHLFVSCGAWPRYGRPHPLYIGRQQTNENIVANAILLGLDLNDIQTLQQAGATGFGLGNIGLPNNGFPMNVYERRRARQDVNTLTALGVIDGPEEAGPLGALVSKSAPDPPDSPGGNDGGGKGRKMPKAKGQGQSNGTNKGKVHNKPGTVAETIKSNSNHEKIHKPSKKPKLQKETTNNRINKGAKQGVGVKLQTPIMRKPKRAKKAKASGTVKKVFKKKSAHKRKRGRQQRLDGEAEGEGGVQRSKQRGNRGDRRGGGDPGEGRLAEQGVGDFPSRPIKGRGRGRVLWRTGSEESPFGGGKIKNRRVRIGRF